MLLIKDIACGESDRTSDGKLDATAVAGLISVL
jgi:hypothetical protein